MCVGVCGCVCVYHLNRCKTSNSAGGHGSINQSVANEAPHMILGYHQVRLVTYLHCFSCEWRPAKPRTGLTIFLLFNSSVLTGTFARQFQQEPSLDSFDRNHRSTFPVLFIDRRSLLGYRNLQPLIFLRYYYLIFSQN